MTKICPRCENSHEKKGTYCSYKCANVRIHTEESKLKTRNSVKKHWCSLTEEQKENHRKSAVKYGRLKSEKVYSEVLEADFSSLTYDKKRWRILIEQNYECKRCFLSEWQGEPLTLELEHKNGDHEDNSRDNLECLCPNCHSLTLTWRGRNNSKDNWRKRINRNRLTLLEK